MPAQLVFLSSLFFLAVLPHVHGAESEFYLPPIVVQGDASFETLKKDSYLPNQNIRSLNSRPGTLESLKWFSGYPAQNYGYPSGASGINLGGRTIEDTQVMTLGVPLNLPQGGGPDLSLFPSYLWDGAIIGHSPSSSGFSPQAASGSLELIPWTRARLKDASNNFTPTRFTASYDRQVQTFSIGTKKENAAILAGMSTGMQRGPSGSLSYHFYNQPGKSFLLHVLGSDLEGDIPGNPATLKKTWRIIPVLEAQLKLEDDLALASTLYGDVSELQGNRSQQIGVENALTFSTYTLAVSARNVRFSNGTDYEEWPLYLGLTDDLYFSKSLKMKATLNANYLDQSGFYPGGKLSASFRDDPKNYPFAELNWIAKMSSLSARYFISDFGSYHYRGNKDLKPERVLALSYGYQQENRSLKSTTLAKLEYRNSIQINTSTLPLNTTINGGSAYLMNLSEDASYRVNDLLSLKSNILLTYSRQKDSNFPYPDLPGFSIGSGVQLHPNDSIDLDTDAKYMGDSTAFDGTNHSGYFLIGERVSYQLNSKIELALGIDNLFDSHAEIVQGFPLPGRLLFTSVRALF